MNIPGRDWIPDIFVKGALSDGGYIKSVELTNSFY